MENNGLESTLHFSTIQIQNCTTSSSVATSSLRGPADAPDAAAAADAPVAVALEREEPDESVPANKFFQSI